MKSPLARLTAPNKHFDPWFSSHICSDNCAIYITLSWRVPGPITWQGSDKSCSKEASCFPNVLLGRTAASRVHPESPLRATVRSLFALCRPPCRAGGRGARAPAFKGLSWRGGKTAWFSPKSTRMTVPMPGYSQGRLPGGIATGPGLDTQLRFRWKRKRKARQSTRQRLPSSERRCLQTRVQNPP